MSFSATLNQLIARQDLAQVDMLNLMRQVMTGELTSAQIAALLIALRIKGESVDEIAAAAMVMRELSSQVKVTQDAHLIDTCGTGGDGNQTFNVSTACAFVASAAGAKVAKHGGRSVSSTSGSADVLEALGVNVSLQSEQVAQCVEQIGIGFMFAPNHHTAMKYAAPVRRELGVRTLFNLLGPLTNPANAKRQVMGVFSPELTYTLAQVLQQLGAEQVMVVHGADGMDEISFSGDTYVAELRDGKIEQYVLNPQQFNLPLHQIAQIQIADATSSMQMLLSVLHGDNTPARDIVLLNAGAAIYVSGLVSDLSAGIQRAAQVIDTGLALEKLHALVALSQSLASKAQSA